MNASLWTFSLSVYRRPGVAEECVLLQDRFGINVNVLLLCLFTGYECGVILSDEDIDAVDCVVREWDTQVTKPLRELRRLLKRHGARSEWPYARSAELLGARMQSAEIESERIESAMLQEWLEGRLAHCSPGARHAAAAANLNRTLAHYGAGNRPELSRCLADLGRSG